jgi:hypothetical protein
MTEAYGWAFLESPNANEPFVNHWSGTAGFFALSGAFDQMTGIGAENIALATTGYRPYDRVIFAPRAGRPFPTRWGAYAYHTDRIFEHIGGGGGWVAQHTCVRQENLLPFHGIHTGLYTVWGTDGKHYKVGIYPAVDIGSGFPGDHVGAVVMDVATGVITSFTQEDLGAGFNKCTVALAWKNKLWLATQGNVFIVDPAAQTIVREDGPPGYSGGQGDDQGRDKLFILSGKLYFCGESSNRMKVFERLTHGTWVEMADLFSFQVGAKGEWALFQDYTTVGVIFRTGIRQWPNPGDLGGPNDPDYNTIFGHWTIDATGPELLAPLTVTDRTQASNSIFSPLNLDHANSLFVETGVDAFITAGHGAEDDAHFQVDTGIALKFAHTAAGEPYERDSRSVGMSSASSAFGAGMTGYSALAARGPRSFRSSRYGMLDDILSRNERSTPTRVLRDDTIVPGAIRIEYVSHTTLAGAPGRADMSTRVYYRERDVAGATGVDGTPQPLKAGTLIGFDPGGGSLNTVNRRIDNVPMTQNGSVHYVIWDKETDLGTGELDAFFVIATNLPANLPAFP